MKLQTLRHIYQITEWRDGCIYKTKPMDYVWIDLTNDNIPYQIEDKILASVSSDVSRKLKDTIRRVSDDTPSMVSVTLKELLP